MKMSNIFKILAGITLIIFIMLLYKKIESWVGNIIGDSNWTLIVIGLLLLIFVVAGFVSFRSIKKKFL